MSASNYLVIGAGVVGLTIARELANRGKSVIVLEKEARAGEHQSGRNSGVLHAGIYYPSDSLKARFCAEGNRLMKAYAKEHKIEVSETGKVIVAQDSSSVPELVRLESQAIANNIPVQRLTPEQLRSKEPHANTHEFAIHSPTTAVIDPKVVMRTLQEEVTELGIKVFYRSKVAAIDQVTRTVKAGDTTFEFDHLVNCAGLYADTIAHMCNVGNEYKIVPFKGAYYQLAPERNDLVNGLIYPTPTPKMPFLGIHFTRSVSGDVYIGPSALPVIGRENYAGQSLKFSELVSTMSDLLKMTIANKKGFRRAVVTELLQYNKHLFFRAAQKLVPELRLDDLKTGSKVGIRAQLVNMEERALVFDFVVLSSEHSTHVLNAISPAFTCSFAFARYICDDLTKR